MTPINPDIVDDAAQAVADFANGPALAAADQTAKLFEAAGERIASALDGAARSGELSFNALAESVARDLARLAISELITSPLQGVLGAAGNSLGGQIAASWGGGGQTKPPVTVNMTVSGVTDASSFSRSQNQISSTLARAVSAGQRYT